MIRKTISLILCLALVLGSSISVFADEVGRTTKEVYEEDGYIIERTTTVGTPTLVKVDKPSVDKLGEINIQSNVDEVTYTYQNSFVDMYVVKTTGGIPCMNHEISGIYKWTETWLVDMDHDIKIDKISQTDPEITAAYNDYEVYATFSLKSYDFSWNKDKASAEGYVENIKIGGGKSFRHTYYPGN